MPQAMPAALSRRPCATIMRKMRAVLGAEGHAHADLGGALPHDRGQHRVETDRREDERDRRRRRRSGPARTSSAPRARSTNVCMACISMTPARGLSARSAARTRGASASGIAAVADGPAVGRAEPHVAVGDEQRLASVGGQRPMPLMIDDADDLEALRLRSANARQERAGRRRIVRETRAPRARRSMTRTRASGRLSVSLNVRPSMTRRAHRLEVAGQDDMDRCLLELRRIGERFLGAPSRESSRAVERERRRGRDARRRPAAPRGAP